MNDSFALTMAAAREHDRVDPLRRFRDAFHIPRDATSGREVIYFAGNSLGLQPKQAAGYVQDELRKWQELGLAGHFTGPFPWMPYHEFLAEPMARIVGGTPEEVVVMNSLTVNLHLMLASFYRPTHRRQKILIEERAFPSDHYAVESHIRHRGILPDSALLVARPQNGSDLFSMDGLCAMIEQERDALALVMLPGVHYYTGQVFDMERITQVAHQFGIAVGFDLAHAAGNIPLHLHDWDVDFAVWCTYKYLNSGPGSVGGCFVHRRHVTDYSRPRLAGWWGHDKKTRFQMENQFRAMETAEGWQVSNPSILSMAAIRASLEVFDEAGGMGPLREKSERLTGFLAGLLQQRLPEQVEIVTPAARSLRGCQLSLKVRTPGRLGRDVEARLGAAGVVTDWREPDVIRAAPVPMYNTFEEVFRFVEVLESCLKA
jgi:kynureninase